ncbi:MAG TPA: isocitrate lyase, partial [Gammaproteobacteria bacterium]|nr:isocitrate lyase [Gammaproteobacteria bacterium]
MSKETDIEKLKQKWSQEDRWNGIVRTYAAEEVVNLRGSFPIEYTLARMGA